MIRRRFRRGAGSIWGRCRVGVGSRQVQIWSRRGRIWSKRRSIFRRGRLIEEAHRNEEGPLRRQQHQRAREGEEDRAARDPGRDGGRVHEKMRHPAGCREHGQAEQRQQPEQTSHLRLCVCVCARLGQDDMGTEAGSTPNSCPNPPRYAPPSRPQVDPESTPERLQIDRDSPPKSTATRHQIDRTSTLDRPQIEPRSTPSRPQVHHTPTPHFSAGKPGSTARKQKG